MPLVVPCHPEEGPKRVRELALHMFGKEPGGNKVIKLTYATVNGWSCTDGRVGGMCVGREGGYGFEWRRIRTRKMRHYEVSLLSRILVGEK